MNVRPTEYEVVNALGVIEHCSDEQLLSLASEAMRQAAIRKNSQEVFSSVDEEYPKEMSI